MKQRFILIGFDGANPELVERFLPHLPSFRRLIAGGSWGPMLSTIPCDTTTNWTALATGATAATSRITGFASFLPGQSLRTELEPQRAADFVQLRAAEFIWEAADRQGRKSIAINYPFSWHSELKHGIVVGGDTIALGRTVLRRQGCLCTPDRMETVRNGTPIALRQQAEGYVGRVEFGPEKERLWGPGGERETGRDLSGEPEGAIYLRPLPGATPRLRVEDAAGQEVAVLVPGEWSEYKVLTLSGYVGCVRFLLVHMSADGSSLQVCHSMITRADGWTKPAHYASRLLARYGPFQPGEEMGLAVGRGNWAGPYTFEAYAGALNRTAGTFLGYARELAGQMPDWDGLYMQLHSPDPLNHWMLGDLDPRFPVATPESTRTAWEYYRRNYQEMDRILGELAELAAQHGAVLVAVSDHSSLPTHTWVDTARPFMARGWLQFDAQGNWDPTRSKIRKTINHSIYVNLKGPRPEGIVEPEDYESVRDEIISTLLAMRDPRTGACPIAVAARREDMDGVGGNGECFGDVIYLMRPGYTNQPAFQARRLTREELAVSAGDPDEGLETGYTYTDGLRGNHHDFLPNASYPGLCTNRAMLLLHGPGIRAGHRIRGARTIDVAPTLAALMEIEPPAQAEGHALCEALELRR